MNKKLVLIKIGGSLITDKNKPFTLRKKALEIIAEEIKKVVEQGDKKIVLGHGGGSFPHVPAKKYKTIKGLDAHKDSVLGMAKVCDAACQLNRIIVQKLLEQNLPAVTVSPFSSLLSEEFDLADVFDKSIDKLLEIGALPVVYGDVILDQEKGCTIFSTERVLRSFGEALIKKGYDVQRIIHCGKTNGVYNQEGETIPRITNKNFEDYKEALGGSGGLDVTGGMVHKVKQSLEMAKDGIPALIIDGIEKGTLSNAILGKEATGTEVVWEEGVR